MINKCYNRDKGKSILFDDEIVEYVAQQLSNVINNAYICNPNWKKEEHEIKVKAIFNAHEIDYFQKANEE